MVNQYTQQQIADITGRTSVNVNRVIAELERLGLIERKGARSCLWTGSGCGVWRVSEPIG